MNIIKEYFISKEYFKAKIIIRTDLYTKSFDHILMLKEQLETDFPGLINDSELDIVVYGGERYKGTYGLEIDIPINTKMPKDYNEVKTVEYLL